MGKLVERRVALLPSRLDLRLVKGLVILGRRRCDGVVVGLVGLDNGAARLLTPAGAPADLAKQRERPLAGAKIGQVQPQVGQQHRRQRNVGQVQAASDHLRANQDLSLAVRQPTHGPFQLSRVSHRVGVPAFDPDAGIAPLQLRLHRLGAGAHLADAPAPALWTRPRQSTRTVAVMAQ